MSIHLNNNQDFMEGPDEMACAGPEQSWPMAPEEMDLYLKENEKIAMSVVAPYRGLDEYDDLLQEAFIGMYKGLLTYDPRKKTKLSTFVFVCAQNELRQFIRRKRAKCRDGANISLESLAEDDDSKGHLLDQIFYRHSIENGGVFESGNIEDSLYIKMAFQAAIRVIREELNEAQRIILDGFMLQIPQCTTAAELHISHSRVSRQRNEILHFVLSRLYEMGFDGVA